ncbi:dihydrofolate reductase family protein [Phreatobacter sp. AB_2022a]|uniref:dihydrofolate reductase family protein n=1 Tax=Phreatobacter sp. AB_2022a TaxID=3003134 RepID=UPI002286D407|nr:dihydrofolate reductase family protein [Phreatobacter sp. AB_2022a]MCZ0737624.1 dihydrofolate reductase family protein [Phreatobacter sp. AB_2022a]
MSESGQVPAPRIAGALTVSLDGFLAAATDGIFWPRPCAAIDPGHRRFLDAVGTVVMGRTTYDRSLAASGAPVFPGRNVVVVTSTPLKQPAERASAWHDALPALIERLRRECRARPALIVGGPRLNNAFIAAGALDQLDIFVVPALAGSGVPLSHGLPARVRLDLVSSKVVGDGVVRLRYRQPEMRQAA